MFSCVRFAVRRCQYTARGRNVPGLNIGHKPIVIQYIPIRMNHTHDTKINMIAREFSLCTKQEKEIKRDSIINNMNTYLDVVGSVGIFSGLSSGGLFIFMMMCQSSLTATAVVSSLPLYGVYFTYREFKKVNISKQTLDEFIEKIDSSDAVISKKRVKEFVDYV